MRKSDSELITIARRRRGRPGFTLVEVAMAVVAGSVLLSSMIYATSEMRKAASGVINETMLQTVARDLQLNLDGSLNAMNKTGLPTTIGVTSTGMNLGATRIRFTAKDQRTQDPGGDFAVSSDSGTTWRSMADIGSRGLFDNVEFAYGKYVTEAEDDIPTPDRRTYVIDDRVRGNLLRVDATLSKFDMVPLHLQMAAAPRALKWSWIEASTSSSPTTDSDGDGVMDDEDDMPLDPDEGYRVRYPEGEAQTASIAFEDLYGAADNANDADYNDLVTAFFIKETWSPGVKAHVDVTRRPKLRQVYLRYFAQARGAGYNHALRLQLNKLVKGGGMVRVMRYDPTGRLDSEEEFSTATKTTLDIFPDTKTQLKPSSDGWSTNARPGTTIQQSWTTVVRITLDDPGQNRFAQTQAPPYDPYLWVKNTSKEIHLPLVANATTGILDSYTFADGVTRNVLSSTLDPWALLVPANFAWPLERQKIDVAYPRYRDWVKANRPEPADWFLYPLENRYKLKQYNTPTNTDAPAPVAEWQNIADKDAAGHDRYVYVFDPKLFLNGEGAYIAPTYVSASAAAVASAATPTPMPAPTATPSADTTASKDLHPLSLHYSIVSGKLVGDALELIAGNATGRFGWLSWDGVLTAARLNTSLKYPGDSSTYTNPASAADHVINIGDFIAGVTEMPDDADLKARLLTLKSFDIIVPTYGAAVASGSITTSGTSGSGASQQYQVSGFAKIRITGYKLSSNPDVLNAKFLGLCDSRGNPVGTVYATPAPTPTPVPTPTPSPTPTATPRPASNDLHPIALHTGVLSGKTVGSVLTDVYCGSGSGNFGWLSWDGDGSAPRLATSLAVPGDSGTFDNPYNLNDHVIDVGDYIWGNTGVSNSSSVRDRLDYIINNSTIITVPVWDAYTGSGSNTRLRTAGFAKLRLTSYQLSGQNRISAVFMGWSDNAGNTLATMTGATPTPAPTPTSSPTPTPLPTATPTPSPTPTPAATPKSSADLYGLMISNTQLSGRTLNSKWEISPGANTFYYANWDGSAAATMSNWVARLTAPGNSETYTNPANVADTHVDLGDLIRYHDNLDNTSVVKNPLRVVEDNATYLTVPVYDAISGTSVVVSGFAKVRLTNFKLNGTDKLEFTYHGMVNSDGSAL